MLASKAEQLEKDVAKARDETHDAKEKLDAALSDTDLGEQFKKLQTDLQVATTAGDEKEAELKDLRRQREEVDEREPRHVARRVRADGGEAARRVVDGVRRRVDRREHRLAVDEQLHL